MRIDQCMDGEAIVAAFGAHPGPDCLKDVLPRFGQRIKVYNSLRGALGEAIRRDVSLSHLTFECYVNLVSNYTAFRSRFHSLGVRVQYFVRTAVDLTAHFQWQIQDRGAVKYTLFYALNLAVFFSFVYTTFLLKGTVGGSTAPLSPGPSSSGQISLARSCTPEVSTL